VQFGPGEVIEGVLCGEPGRLGNRNASVFVLVARGKMPVVERGISAFLPYHFRGWIPLAVSSKMCRRPLPTRPKFDELATASRLSKNGEYFTAQPLYPCVR
jgi:hypothetical protein